MKDKSAQAVVCATLGNIIWGLSFLLTKVGLSEVPDPNVMLAHRFILATAVMSMFMLFGKRKLSFKGKNWRPVVILLLTEVAYFFFETYGVLHTNSTISGLVLAVVPVVTIGTGILFLREYPTRRQALFCVVMVVGVIIMTVSGKELGVVTPLGLVFLALAMLTSAIYKTANRKAATEFDPFERTFIVLANSAVVFTFLGMSGVDWSAGAFVEPLTNGKYLLCVLSLSLLCSIGANMLVNYASTHMSVFKVSSFGSVSTLCSVVAGVVF